MLARKSILMVLNSLVGAILGFVAIKVIALYMGADLYGQLAFAMSLVGLVTFLGNLGFSKAHNKLVSEGRDAGDCISTFAAWNLGIASVYILVIGGGLLVNELFIHKPFVSTTVTTILLVTVADASNFIRRTARETFKANVETARSELTVFSEHVVRAPVMIMAALFYASARDRQGPIFDFLRDTAPGLAELVGDYGPEALAFAVLAAGLVSMFVGLFLLFRYYRPGKIRYDLLKDYASFGLPVVGASSMNGLQSHADKSMLGFFWSDRATGQYYGVQRVLSFVHILYNSVGQVLFPVISEYDAEGDVEATRSVLNQAIRYISMITVPAAFGAAALATPIIRIMLSADFLAAVPILVIVAFELPFRGITAALTNLQFGTDQPKLAAALSVMNSVTNIALGFLLIPASFFGFPLAGMAGVGAALATLFAYIVDVSVRSWSAQRYLDPSVLGRILRHWAAGALMGGGLWLVQATILPTVRWYALPMLIGAGGIAYFAFLWAFREFTREDVEFLWAAIHPGEMGDYVRSEILGRRDEDTDRDTDDESEE